MKVVDSDNVREQIVMAIDIEESYILQCYCFDFNATNIVGSISLRQKF